MTLYSYFKRRILGKWAPVLKRIALPLFVLYIIIQVSSRTTTTSSDRAEENMIVPGEALDPIERSGPEETIGKGRRTGIKNSMNKGKVTVEKEEAIRKNLVLAPPTPNFTATLAAPPTPKEAKAKMRDDSDVPSRIKTDWSMAKANVPDAHKVKFRPHAITNDTITLTLLSSADKVFMSLNKKEIYRSLDTRGMHIVVLNQFSGRVMAKRVFDTFQYGVEEDMIDFLEDITDGRIVVFAILDEVATDLTWKGRSKLKEMGCRFADKIAFRDMWAMATRKGGLKIAETYSNVATADTGYEWGGPIFMRTDFDLEERPVECEWPYSEKNLARRRFCLRYEGYGALCQCDIQHWEDVFFSVDNEAHNKLSTNPMFKDLAVVILATNRPHYLFRTLKTLHEAPGLNKDRLVIYTERVTREVAALAELFGATVATTGILQNATTPQKIRHKVAKVFSDLTGEPNPESSLLSHVLDKNSQVGISADNILILEEDFQVAVDIFKYLYEVSPILKEDPTVLALSAFNYHGFVEVASSQTTFYRTNDAHGLALMLPSRTIRKILLPGWPIAKSNLDWWQGLYLAMEKGDGDIVFPEISRAKHSSFEGYLIKGGVQRDWFRDHVLSMTTEYEIMKEDVERLKLDKYKSSLENTIKVSTNLVFDFCEHELIYGKDPSVMYVNYDGKDDTDLRYVMKCLKTWAVYAGSGWKGLWQFHFHGHLLTIVGVPYSPFSKLKTAGVEIVTAPPTFSSNVTTDSTTTV